MPVRIWQAESLVNTVTSGNQDTSHVAALSNGGFIIVWRDSANSGDVRARRFGADGLADTGELLVENGAAAALDPYVVATTGGAYTVYYSSGTSILGRGFDASDALVSSGGISNASRGATVVRADGGFATAYETPGGEIEGFGPNPINTTTAGDQDDPDIALLTNGRLVVVWQTDNVDVRARIINEDQTPFAADFAVDTSNLFDSAGTPRVIGLAGGGFVVVWQSITGTYPGDAKDIRARIFSSSGGPQGPDFLVNIRTAGEQNAADVAALPDGGFVVVWRDEEADLVRGQRFDGLGGRAGADFVVSTASLNSGLSRKLTIATLADGRLAVTWSTGDGSGTGVVMAILDPRDGEVVGTSLADLLYGGQFDDQIVALGGADTIIALAGADVIYAGLGADTVFAGLGDDSAYGGEGNDLLNLGTGADVAYGDLGDDLFFAELGDDLLFGQDGNDTLNGGGGADTLYGQNGNDVAFGEDGDDAFFMGFGNDTAFTGAGNDVAFGEEGGDNLQGEDGDDLLDGGAGGDVLNGGNGVDNLVGGADGDILIGGPGGDCIEGGTGGDLIWYQAQNEVNDLIVGFNPAEDQLQFTGSQFGGFTAGSNLANSSTFVSSANPNPTGAVPTFLYNSADGSLFFDADGTGPGARIFIALIQGAPGLTAGDFQFV